MSTPLVVSPREGAWLVARSDAGRQALEHLGVDLDLTGEPGVALVLPGEEDSARSVWEEVVALSAAADWAVVTSGGSEPATVHLCAGAHAVRAVLGPGTEVVVVARSQVADDVQAVLGPSSPGVVLAWDTDRLRAGLKVTAAGVEWFGEDDEARSLLAADGLSSPGQVVDRLVSFGSTEQES